jgi:hypothetical protein
MSDRPGKEVCICHGVHLLGAAMKTSFVAFGQDHTDASALDAIEKHIVMLHKALTDQGKQIVLAVEHAQQDVQTQTKDIAERYNKGVAQSWFDKKREDRESPTFEDFKRDVLPRLRQDSATVFPITAEYLMKEEGKSQRLAAKYADQRQEQQWKDYFNRANEASTHDINRGRGPGIIAEANLLQYATNHGLKVVGLDPVSDREKQQRLTGGEKIELQGGISHTTSDGKLDGAALEDMEYERVQGMAQNVCMTMAELENDKGGCLVAFNMGIAHLGSLDVALNDEMSKRAELTGARVKMCTLFNGTVEQMETEVNAMLNMSPNEILASVGRAKDGLRVAENLLRESVETKQKVAALLERLDSLGEHELVGLLKNPQDLLDHLNKGLEDPDLELEIDDIAEMLQEAEIAFGKGGYPTLKNALSEQFADWRKALDRMDTKIAKRTVSVEHAHAKLEQLKGQEAFAIRVQTRLSAKPSDVFVCAPSEGPLGYDSLIRKTLQEANGLPQVKSLRETLGSRFTNAQQHLENDAKLGTSEARQLPNPKKMSHI